MTVTRLTGLFVMILIFSIGACSGGGGGVPSVPDLPSESDLPGETNLPENEIPIFDGYLTDSDGFPLTDVIVTVYDTNDNLLGETITNGEGYFFFELDPFNDYRITTRKASGDQTESWEYTAPAGENNEPVNPDGSDAVNGSTGTRIWVAGGGNISQVENPDDFIIEPGIGSNPNYSIRGASSMKKILPSMDLNSLSVSIGIEGARGEHEAFQVVPFLKVGTPSIRVTEVTASDLVKGPDKVLSENISLFLEHYILITEATDAGGATGYWPDALAPLTDPFDVVDNFPSPVWVDVNIPRSAAPGTYNGNINFITSDNGTFIFHYSVEVWNITFPKRFYIKANIGLDQEDIASTHNLPLGLGTPDGREMAREYASFLADRHISTHGIPLFQPRVILSPDRRSFSINYTEMQTDMQIFLDGYDQNNFQFPLDRFDCKNGGFIAQNEPQFSSDFNARYADFVNQVSIYLSSQGYLDRTYIWMVDEPHTHEMYDRVRDWYDLIHQAQNYPDYMVTEQAYMENPAWGSLKDYVDIFTMSVRVLQYGDEDIIREDAAGKEEWIYTNASVHPYPSVAIDKQGVELRLFLWLVYQHEYQGTLYASANNWTIANPWDDAMTHGPDFGNGASSLLYPGTMCEQYTGQDNVNGPITSIRMETFRDGLEDTQLMYMVGNGNPVSIVDTVIPDWDNYSDNPEEVLQVRRTLAGMITGGN